MKKLLTLLLSGMLLAGLSTAASAWEENVDYIKVGDTSAANYPASTAELPECTTGQLLRGTAIANVSTFGFDTNEFASMFDGDTTTSYLRKELNWSGVLLDQAYELTEVRAAPNPETDAFFGFWVQGSNDGVNWVDIIIMRQDAHGADYHIFTPQTVTDQRYIDAGYNKRKDESIHWVGKGGSYSIYRVLGGDVAELELYGNPAPATELTPETTSAINTSTPYYYPRHIHVRADAEVLNSVDGSLVGTIIGGGGSWNKAFYENAFDGSNRTCYDASGEGPECWVGMMFDEPHALTEVRILPKRGNYKDIRNSRVQGSLDGVNWVDLAVFTLADAPSKQEWVTKPVTDTNGYTYFRFVSTHDTQSSVAELLLFGAPAEAAEPFTVDPLIATHDTYTGEIHYAEQKNTVVDTEISGTPICGKYYHGWIGYGRIESAAFDNNFDTYYGSISNLFGSEYWVGLKPDGATVATEVKFYNVRADSEQKTLYFQGSLDGVTWTDLTSVTTSVDKPDETGWLTKTITDPTAYRYFRLMSDYADHPYTSIEVTEMKIYGTSEEPTAPETTAPETAAPETAAPETAAPETTAPATAAPETAAPETAAPETEAPADTDTDANNTPVIIGAAAAVVAGILAVVAVVTKKKK